MLFAGATYDCRECPTQLRPHKGCEDPTERPAWKSALNGEELFRCPINYLTRQAVEMVHAFEDYEHGILPARGGMRDQTAWFVAALRIVSNAVARMRQIEQANREAEARHERSAVSQIRPGALRHPTRKVKPGPISR